MASLRNTSTSLPLEARLRLILESVKVVGLLLGGLGLFLFVTRPESILDRTSSQDAIAREHARLVLEWMREEDPALRAEAFDVIRAAYGKDDWISDIELALSKRANQEARAAALTDLADLFRKRDELERQAEAELRGETGNPPGLGPTYQALRSELESIEVEIVSTQSQLLKFGSHSEDLDASLTAPVEEP